MLLEGERTENASMSLFASKQAEVARLLLTCGFIHMPLPYMWLHTHAPALCVASYTCPCLPAKSKAWPEPKFTPLEKYKGQFSKSQVEPNNRGWTPRTHEVHLLTLHLYRPVQQVTTSLNVTRMVCDVLGQPSLFATKLPFASEVWIWNFAHNLIVWSLCFQHCLGSLWDHWEVEPHWRKQVTEGRVLRFYSSALLPSSPYILLRQWD